MWLLIPIICHSAPLEGVSNPGGHEEKKNYQIDHDSFPLDDKSSNQKLPNN